MTIASMKIAVGTGRAAKGLPAGRFGNRANEMYVGNSGAPAMEKVLHFKGKVLGKGDNAGYCKDVPYDGEVSMAQGVLQKKKRTSGSPALTSGTPPRPRACNLGRAAQ